MNTCKNTLSEAYADAILDDVNHELMEVIIDFITGKDIPRDEEICVFCCGLVQHIETIQSHKVVYGKETSESVLYQNWLLKDDAETIKIIDDFFTRFQLYDDKMRKKFNLMPDDSYNMFLELKAQAEKRIADKPIRIKREHLLNKALIDIYEWLDKHDIPVMEQCERIFKVYAELQYNECNLIGRYIDRERKVLVPADIDKYLKKYPGSKEHIEEITKLSKITAIHKYKTALKKDKEVKMS